MPEDFLLQVQHSIPWVVYGTIVVGLIILALVHRKSKDEQLQGLARELGGTIAKTPWKGKSLNINAFGAEQRITWGGNGKENMALGFHQRTTLDFTLKIVRETLSSRAAQNMGLATEVEVGDPAFDRKYRIKTDSPEKSARFLDSPERKRIVDLLFAEDFDCITIRKGEVSFFLEAFTDEDENPPLLKKRLDILTRFVSGAAAPSRPS